MQYDDDASESYAPRSRASGRGPGLATVILVSALTAAAISVATVMIMERLRAAPTHGSSDEATVVQVPSVVGMPSAAADEVLRGRDLRYVVREERHDRQHVAGNVIEQSPLAGSRVDPQESISVVLSKGPPPIEVPQIIGLSVEAARTALAEADLAVGPVSETGTGEPGTVVATVPPPGTEATANQPIALTTVAAGVLVPRLIGQSQRRARETIEGLGLTVGRVRERYDERFGAYIVLEQHPDEGATATPGSAIDLVLNEGD